MPPAYVKPYLKRQKNDMADAEAICEAVTRPTMRCVPLKTVDSAGCADVASFSRVIDPATHNADQCFAGSSRGGWRSASSGYGRRNRIDCFDRRSAQ
jgi:transposase